MPVDAEGVVVDAKIASNYLAELFFNNGATAADANDVADHLVEASLAGHDLHGIIRAPEYLEKIEEGLIDTKARPEVAAEGELWASVEGHWGFGQPCSRFRDADRHRQGEEDGNRLRHRA